MENFWIMFNHVKHLKNWTTMAYHVYDSQYYKFLPLRVVTCNLKMVQYKFFFEKN